MNTRNSFQYCDLHIYVIPGNTEVNDEEDFMGPSVEENGDENAGEITCNNNVNQNLFYAFLIYPQ